LQPVFQRGILNLKRAPWAALPLIRVSAGIRCAYRAPVAENPYYRGLALPAPALGCTFCGAGSTQPPPIRDALAFAVRHVEAACRQRYAAGTELRFELLGHALWQRLEVLISALVRRGVRDAELSFMPRIDELLRSRSAVERCLPLMAERGLAMRIYSLGVENFSPAENLRLNKGITAAQVHEVTAFITAMTARWPGQFRFSVGELSMILFTPWTTLEDLRINLDNISRCPLICTPHALGQRLQIFPDRPIARLAAQDGLLVKDPRSPFYNSGCIVSFDQTELPWRFLHPEVAPLCRLGLELSLVHTGAPGAAPQIRTIAASLSDFTTARSDPLALFRRAVDTIARHPKTASLADLLRRLC
jgi:hypothetical protein